MLARRSAGQAAAVTLLDLDGCIVDSAEPILTSLSAALESLGLRPIRSEDLGRVIGPPLAATIPRLLADRGAHDVPADEVIARYRATYRDAAVTDTRVYPGMRAAIEQLARQGPVGVVTSKPLAYTVPILEAAELDDRFVLIEGPSLAETESKVDTLARALRGLGGVDPADAMVGDRRHDVDAGRAHSIHTVGVTWGFGTRAELLDAGVELIVDEPGQLPDAVAASRKANR